MKMSGNMKEVVTGETNAPHQGCLTLYTVIK